MSRLLGVRSPTEVTQYTANPYAVAKHLWGAGLAKALEHGLVSVEVLRTRADLVLLAATIPNERVRAALLRLLQSHCDEQPPGLDAEGALNRVTLDPGFLIVVKMLPRKDPDDARTTAIAKPARLAAVLQARQQLDHSAQQWMKFSESVLQTMRQQFCSVATSAGGGSNLREASPDSDDLHLKIHPQSEVLTTYRADWPEGLDAKANGLSLSPMKVRYLRMQLRARPARLLAYYRHQLPNCKEHTIQGGTWLDMIARTDEEGTVRSTDVLITPSNTSLSNFSDQEQRLIVEVLSIRVGGLPTSQLVAEGK